MTEQMEAMSRCILLNRVPAEWKLASYPSDKVRICWSLCASSGQGLVSH